MPRCEATLFMSSAARHRCAFLIAAAVPLIACHGPHPGSMTSSEPIVTRIGSGVGGLQIALHHQPPTARGPGSERPPVLFVHGATFPTALAAGYRFDGVSWMDELAHQGFDVWGLDFLGYGDSDRYPEMHDAGDAHPPLGRAEIASVQIAAAVDHICATRRVSQVSLVAHSWGTIAAGRYAADHAEQLDRLVLFGPVALRTGPAAPAPAPAWHLVTVADQRDRFYGYVPDGEPPAIAPRYFAEWGPAYLASDPSSGSRDPASVLVPNGPSADIDDAWSGHLPYDPARISAPTLIVRGAWETVTTDADARWLYDALRSALLKRDVKIDRGTHVMHLEASRRQLYREVAAFITADDR
jgi:pimeloyl-ACP methyl ester carboxylesterase